MNWTTILRAQQADFILRLKSGCLLHWEKEGQHSELTVISGERLKRLRKFCWRMAEKFKQNSDVEFVFINNLKGKLGEEVVKARLAEFVTEVDYEKKLKGDGKFDFRLTSDPSVKIQVKARHGNIDTVQWSISREEIEKNTVLVCILIQEELSEDQTEYNLIMAGFLPTNMIQVVAGKFLVGIDELLYCGGLRSYLEYFKFSQHDYYISLGDDCFAHQDYLGAITNYSQALQLNPRDAKTYLKRASTRYELRDLQGAITDYNQVLRINPNFAEAYIRRGTTLSALGDRQGAIKDYAKALQLNPNNSNAYYNRGVAYSILGNRQGAIKDYNQALQINPNNADAYYNRGNAHYALGNKQGAIDDFNQALRINPNKANVYYNRGNTRYELGDRQGAIDDFNQAAYIYNQEGNDNDYNDTLEKLKYIQDDEDNFGNKDFGFESEEDDESCLLASFASDLNSKLSELDDVKSASFLGIDYTSLRNLLADGKWKEADKETERVMLAMVNKDNVYCLRQEDFNKFPNENLHIIDQLWVKYSNNHFGFSVQENIYQSLCETRHNNWKIWEAFGNAVGWRKKWDWLFYENITFNVSAPKGHLPSFVLWCGWGGVGGLCWVAESWDWSWCEILFSYFETSYANNPKSKIQNPKLPESDDVKFEI